MNKMEIGNLLFGNSRGNYTIERTRWQDPFCKFLTNNGFDEYGYRCGSEKRCFENDTFIIRPYYWGEDEEIAKLPNFEYKPTKFTLSWYKYPMRDAYASHNITTEEFIHILKECEKSLEQF